MSNNWVLVTGGNRGIGYEVCRNLVQSGRRVLLCSRDAQAGQEAAADIARRTGRPDACVSLQLDTSSQDSIAALTDTVRQSYDQRVGVLINNAAIYQSGWTPEEFDTFKRTNYLGPVALARQLAPHMTEGGRIVNVSSGFGQQSQLSPAYQRAIWGANDLDSLAANVQFIPDDPIGSSIVPCYKVTKNMLCRATQLLANSPELRGRGVTCNACDPGWVRTRMGGSSATGTVEKGASSLLWLIQHPEPSPNAGFFQYGRPISW
ncbi:hypothetical protein WJX72_011612 [[Myrmecia] bisecta]|uniref:Uncharacterized protein n=1 Tax=[Myrmecia] bisecta TaxID=41462 RepID=A0AAW1QSZ9_9CHLO